MSSYYFQNCFDFLKNNHRVIYYDQRGSGFSQIKSNLEYYTFDRLVEDLEIIRKKVIQGDEIKLIGHSFGGLISMKYAIDHEENADKLVLISTSPARFREKKNDGIEIMLKHGIPLLYPELVNSWLIKVLVDMFSYTFLIKLTFLYSNQDMFLWQS